MSANDPISLWLYNDTLGVGRATRAIMGLKEKTPQDDALKRWALFAWRKRAPAALPPLLTAMRQLRQQILDARGEGAAPFVAQTSAIAALARENGEHAASEILQKLAMIAELGRDHDVRALLLDVLDEAHAALNPPDGEA